VSEEHLDFLSAMPGLLVFRCDGNRSGDVLGVLVEIARQLAGNGVWAADLFE
jgi:hypothetical protein